MDVNGVVRVLALDVVEELVVAVSEAPDDGSRLGFRIGQDVIHALIELLPAHPAAERGGPFVKQPHPGHDGLEITPDRIADPGIVLEDVRDVAVELPGPVEPRGPEAEAFLVDLEQVG